MDVPAWLPRAAAARPDHEAVNAITYAELLDRARRAAAGLRAAGVRPGDRVGLAIAASEDFALALHGCLLLGAVAVPLDTRAPSAYDVDHLIGAPPDGDPDGAGEERHDLDAPAIVVHTSGTTSEPRPVVLTYGNWLWSALGSAVALGHPRDERWLCALPLTHVGGLSILLRSVIAGTTVLLHERWSTDAVLAGLDDATIVSLVPTTLRRLLDAGLREPPALRWALLGGAPIPPDLLARAADAGVPVAPTYGLTEACSQVTTHGVPLFCTRVELAGDGEIVVHGPTVAGGGPLYTGDLGAWDEHGRLEITGRKADTIVTGGENVAPAEVEAVLETHPDVAEAAVHGRADPEWGEAVVATVVPRDGAEPAPEALRAHAAAALAPYKVPKEIAIRREPLPRTGSGKLLRRELHQRVPATVVPVDPDEFRAEAREHWDLAAPGWEARREAFQRFVQPVSVWLVERIAPQPGHVVLELACGPGDTGLLAAELVKPGGRVILTDTAEGMVEAARRRAAELGVDNAEARVMDAEWIDLETASVDGVLCRFGYMLLVDPEAALRETRRVLRPGGRVALAAWTAAEDNTWLTAIGASMTELGLAEPPPADAPGPFSFAEPGRIEALLAAAGFDDIVVETLDLVFAYASTDEHFEHQRDVSPRLRDQLATLTPAQHTALRDAIDAKLEPYVRPDGSVEIPGRTWVAAAVA